MPLRRLILVAALCLPAPTLAGADSACGPHQHVESERDEDEGGVVRRCVCDAGWDADGPGRPCRSAAAAAGKPARTGKRRGGKH
jgi:hypothetical protein